jgi:hypothetical protein
MFAAGNDLVSFIDEFATRGWALRGDATGLQWAHEVPVLLLALDFSEEVLEEALLAGAPFIFTHQPFLYRPLNRLQQLNRQREELSQKIDKELLKKYRELSKRRLQGGRYVSLVKGGFYVICNVSLPSSFRARLLNPGQLVFCENGGFLLVRGDRKEKLER